MNKVVSFLVKYKIVLFTGTILLLVLGLSLLNGTKFNGKLNGFDLEENVFHKLSIEIDSLFSTKNKVLLLVTPEGNDKSQIFKSIDIISDSLKDKYAVSDIISPLTLARSMRHEFRHDRNSFTVFLKHAKEIPLLSSLVSKDSTSFLMVVGFEESENLKMKDLNNIILHEYKGFSSVKALSIFHVEENIETFLRKDIRNISFGILMFFVIFYLVLFRRISAIFYTMIIVGVSIAIALLLFSVFGMDITMVSVLVIPVVLILSLSDSVHLLTAYLSADQNMDRDAKLKYVLKRYIVPSFFSSLTTAAAFLSFYFFNESTYIREFGLLTGLALLLEFFLTFLTAPFILSVFNMKVDLDKTTLRIASFFERNKRKFSAGFVLVFLASVFASPSLIFKTDSDVFFPHGSELRKTHEEFTKQFYSQINLNVVLRAKEGNTVTPKLLRIATSQLTDSIRSFGGPVNVTSATDVFKFRTKYGFPENIFNVLGENNPYHSNKHNVYRIDLKFNNSEEILQYVDHTLPALLKTVSDEVRVEYSSEALIMDYVNRSVASSLVNSLLSSGLVIFIIILILTRSISLSVLSMLPNLVPLSIVVVFYVLFGMNINILTAITGVVCLGLLDDDTVHILYRRLWLKEDIKELSFSMLVTALLLCGGFGLFLLSNFQPTKVFGGVSALVFLLGVICEVTLMQLILDWYCNKIKKTDGKA